MTNFGTKSTHTHNKVFIWLLEITLNYLIQNSRKFVLFNIILTLKLHLSKEKTFFHLPLPLKLTTILRFTEKWSRSREAVSHAPGIRNHSWFHIVSVYHGCCFLSTFLKMKITRAFRNRWKYISHSVINLNSAKAISTHAWVSFLQIQLQIVIATMINCRASTTSNNWRNSL